MLVTIISAVVVLGVLIFVHELGHFAAAKWAGVGVQTFSLGFGPRLFGKRVGETDYRISAIPLGGFVKMVGENPTEEVTPEEEARSFSHKSVWKRMIIVAAGPLSNVALAVVAYYILAIVWGQPVLSPVVGEVIADMPAQAAGAQTGDVVKTVNGAPIDRWDQLREAVRLSGGKPVELLIDRNGQELTLRITPKTVQVQDLFGDTIEIYQIGLGASGQTFHVSYGPIESMGKALESTWNASHLIITSVGKIISGKVSRDQLGGPIYIAQVAGEAARKGLDTLLAFAAIISVNLAVLNLLPIPALDGGHLLVFLVEAIIRRPVSIAVRERIQQVGVIILLSLMVFVIWNDLNRLKMFEGLFN